MAQDEITIDYSHTDVLCVSLCVIVDAYPDVLKIHCDKWGVTPAYLEGDRMDVPATIRRLAKFALKADRK